jgi:hypothetical protein
MEFLQQLLEKKSDIDPKAAIEKLSSVQKSDEVQGDTAGFALEDENGNVVRVRVPKDQADDFEQAMGVALNGDDDTQTEDVQIAEVLFDLRKRFDIVDVNWGEGTIPEDEEVDNELQGGEDQPQMPADGEPVDGDVEGPDGEFPNGEDPDGEETPMDATDSDIGFNDDNSDQNQQAMSALEQIIDLMKSDAEARRIEAEARKAEASVEAGKVAAQAAAARTAAEEEILDMENFNKRKKEDKRQRDLQAKLLRYRHDVKNDQTGELDMGMNENAMYPHATAEEEEVLDMEAWEKEEAERNKQKQTHEKLKKYRHAQKTNPEKFKKTFKEFNDDVEAGQEEMQDQIDLSHRVQA